MLEQFNDFMEALDQQIAALDKEIANLENKKLNLNKAREQFVETSKLLDSNEENVDMVKKTEVEAQESAPVEYTENTFNIDTQSTYTEEVSSFEETVMPEVEYEEVTPAIEEQIEVAPIEETAATPVEVFDNNVFPQVEEENGNLFQ